MNLTLRIWLIENVLDIPTSWYSSVLFLVSPNFVPSLSAKYWDLVWSHLWLTEELSMSVCGRNVLCENDSLLNHGAKIQHPQKPIIRFYTFLAIQGHFYQGFAALERLFSWCYMNRICWTEVCKLLRISLLDEWPLWASVSVSVVSVIFWGVPISHSLYILLIIS